jgi:hypothetical protein
MPWIGAAIAGGGGLLASLFGGSSDTPSSTQTTGIKTTTIDPRLAPYYYGAPATTTTTPTYGGSANLGMPGGGDMFAAYPGGFGAFGRPVGDYGGTAGLSRALASGGMPGAAAPITGYQTTTTPAQGGLLPSAAQLFSQFQQGGPPAALTQAWNQIGNLAAPGGALNQVAGRAAGGLQNFMSPNFLGGAWGVPQLSGIAGGWQNPGAAALGPAAGGAINAFNPAAAALGQMAYNPQADPYAQGLVSSALSNLANQYQNAIAPANIASAALANRYGSGAAANQLFQGQRALGIGMGQAIPSILSPIYQAQAQRQLGAAQQLGGQYLTGTQQQIGAAEALGQLTDQQKQIAAQAAQGLLSGYGNLANTQLGALRLAPEIQQMMLTAPDVLARTGMQQFGLPWQNMANYANILHSVPGGTQTIEQQPIYPNPGASFLGGATAGLDIWQQMGKPGWGSIFGGGTTPSPGAVGGGASATPDFFGGGGTTSWWGK